VRVEHGDIRFDIQEWRPINGVHIFNFQQGFLDTSEPDSGETEYIWLPGCPRGEYPVGPGIKKRFTSREWPLYRKSS
jgi:hypothetical protein